MEGGYVSLGNLAPVPAFLVGAVDDLVVHVCKVAHKADLKPCMAQLPHEHVKNKGGTRMSYMAKIIGRYAANIHVCLARMNGNKFFLFTAQGIVEQHVCPVPGLTGKIDHVDAALVPAAFKGSAQKCLHNGLSQFHADDARAEAKHIGVVVLARQARLKLSGAQGRADAGVAVGGNGNAYACTANENACSLLFFHSSAKLVRQHGVVAAFGRVGAVVHHVDALLGKKLDKVFFQRIASVV